MYTSCRGNFLKCLISSEHHHKLFVCFQHTDAAQLKEFRSEGARLCRQQLRMSGSRVYVGGLRPDATERELEDEVSRCADSSSSTEMMEAGCCPALGSR